MNTWVKQKLNLGTSQIQKTQIHSILALKEKLTFYILRDMTHLHYAVQWTELCPTQILRLKF